jgi:hypothetical protein
MIESLRTLRRALAFHAEDWARHVTYDDVTQLLNVSQLADAYLRALDAVEPIEQTPADFDDREVRARHEALEYAEKQLRGALNALALME